MTNQHGVLLVLLCSCVGTVITQNPLLVFQNCVLRSGIPPVEESDPLLKTIFEITQTTTTVDMLLQCVEDNRTRLMNSSNVVEWFVGHTFDPQSAGQALNETVGMQGKVNESSCLRTLAPQMTSCLQRMVTVLGDKTPNVKTVDNICSLDINECMYLPSQTGSCSTARQVLLVVVNLFYGQCASRWNGWNDNPTASALFTCGDRLFPDNALAMLFPPTASTLQLIQNVTAAAIVQAESLQIFCRNISEYTSCLQDTLKYSHSQVNDVLRHMLNIDRLPDTFHQYCSHRDLISSQFECTFEAVKKSRCGGGIVDILMSLTMPIPDVNTLCMRTRDEQECRIKSELTPCNRAYGSAMGQFYSGLKSETCNWKPADIGEFVRCSQKYTATIIAEINKMGGMSNISGIVSYSMDYVCGDSVRGEWMQCVRHVERTSNHPIDKLILNMMIPVNLETIFDYSCSMRQELKKHSFCVMASFGEIANSQNSCMTYHGNKLSEKMQDVLKKSNDSSDVLSSSIPEICAYMTPISKCMEPAFDKCSAELSKYFTKLTGYIQESCGSTKAVAMNAGARNLASRVLATLILLTSLLIVR